MNVSLYRKPRRFGVLLLPLLAAACTDSILLPPTPGAAPVEALAVLKCTVQVQSAVMSCESHDPTTGTEISATRIFGSQDRNVKLTSSGGVYDGGTQIFQTNVTVQNLTQQALGLDSLNVTSGVRVFFSDGPNVTSGPGPVTVANPTGQAFITAANQDYFLYNEVIQPEEISSSMQWQFSVPSVTTTFSFVVMIQAAQPEEDLPLNGPTWQGTISSEWTTAGNWSGGVPDSASSVNVWRASLLPVGANMPALSADAQLTNLGVGVGSTLTLNGNTLTAWGNVDALGSVADGTLWMRGADVVLGGNLPSVRITGSTTLQRTTTASGAVSISDGSLVVSGSAPLSISIP